ncbi:MAG: hypothetical protein IRY99_16075, partial [Isosphaeraceae bacterium]|nr:hypothetical protein [Isosphaeraceae bacterium]
FFGARARGGLATSLALALLAGKGFDDLSHRPRPGRALVGFVLIAAAWIASVVLFIELALPVHDPAITRRVPAIRSDQMRWLLYAEELKETGVLLVALLALAPLSRRRGLLRTGLAVLAFLDLWLLGRHRPILEAPIRPLTSQSPLLARLAQEPRGTRVLFPQVNNLAQVAGIDTLPAYRTLDLPVTLPVTIGSLGLSYLPDVREYEINTSPLRALGVAASVSEPNETALLAGLPRLRRSPQLRREVINDPALASWMFDTPWWIGSPKAPSPPTFTLWRLEPRPARAWLLPGSASARVQSMPISLDRLADFWQNARPLGVRSPVPERVEIDVHAEEPSFVVISQLDYPEWRARWKGPNGERPATIERAFGHDSGGAWQRIAVPEPGDWTLTLEFEGQDVRDGLKVSGLAWILWGLAYAWSRRRWSEDRLR